MIIDVELKTSQIQKPFDRSQNVTESCLCMAM